ncbi:glutathione S-transferase [Sorangium cellulosum]|uniref:Glutathione S-transferase n=1 Tax=Sorangium cellulosum TaxID=56 RepID=A0A4P2Q830_SORCE|nr:glutathione S-transferase family protein [Sorangium cellulosum]AUX25346.1 glutathione S-transferase [Sorangium cellulosum]
MSITFYYSPQSSAGRIRVSLAELDVPHEIIRVDLRAGDQKKPDFLALNPNGKVPTLVIDGTPMFESVAIQIALGERYGVQKGLWPAPGAPERLMALTWLVWGQVSLTGALFHYMANTSEYFPKEMHNEKQAEQALTEVRDLLRILDSRLDGRPYLTGERCTLADLDLASVLGWGLPAAKIDSSEQKNVHGWLGRIMERPAVKAAMVET